MAAQRVVFSFALAIGALAALHCPAHAQNPGTMDQQMACTPDVWRLCGAQVPDVDRIVACLRQNTALLSPPCRAVFETNVNPPQQTARTRGRINQPRPQYDDAYQPRPQYDQARPQYEGPPPQRRPRYDDDDE